MKTIMKSMKTTFSYISYILGTIFHAGLKLGTYVVMNPATFYGK